MNTVPSHICLVSCARNVSSLKRKINDKKLMNPFFYKLIRKRSTLEKDIQNVLQLDYDNFWVKCCSMGLMPKYQNCNISNWLVWMSCEHTKELDDFKQISVLTEFFLKIEQVPIDRWLNEMREIEHGLESIIRKNSKISKTTKRKKKTRNTEISYLDN